MMLKGLVFDMDGLLFDTERIVQRSWNLSGADLGYPHMGEHIYNTIGFNSSRREKYFKGICGTDFPYDRFEERAALYFMDIVEGEGLPVKRGVKEILDFAKSRGLSIGLATSSPDGYALENLRIAGIRDYFDGYVCGNMIKKSKPDPEIYLKACAAIGVEPSEAAALEDAPSGIASAYAAGLKTIMIPDLVRPDGKTLESVWKTADSLTEVIPILEEELEKA